MAAQLDHSVQKPRRFYTTAIVVEHQGGFGVALDGRLAKTPAGAPLVAPTRGLGQMVATEWAAQGESIDSSAMPATRLAFTAIDRAPSALGALADEVARYAASDLLCYFAEGPTALLEQEVAHWTPVLDWAHDTLGLKFVRVTGVIHQAQPAKTLARSRSLAAELDVFGLTGLVYACALFGSAILAFAVQRAMLTGDAALDLSRLDDAYQEQRWGIDAEAAARTANMRRDAEMAERWFSALRT